MSPGTSPATAGLVKCVVWDLDHTLLTSVYLEADGEPPAADPVLAGVLSTLAGRGILHAVASKNPPAAAVHAAEVTGARFAAVECGWGRKSDALTRIAAELGIGTDTLAFVDDDPYERAEVAAAVPGVLVLSPEDAAEAPGWPQFSPGAVTAEARRRGELYAARQRRQQAERAFGGSRDDFLRTAGTQVTIAAAGPGQVSRLAELAVRTRQFNSAGEPAAGTDFGALLRSPGHDVIAVWLRDAYCDDGLVGACVVEWRDHGWRVWPLLMSCRAMGRGVVDALLVWLVRSAGRQGVASVEVPCLLTERNVPLRLALAGAGFRAAAGPEPSPVTDTAPACGTAGAPVVFRRDPGGAVPELPGWVAAPGEPRTAWEPR